MVIYIKKLDKNDKLECLKKYPIFLRKFIIRFVCFMKMFFIEEIEDGNKIIIISSIDVKKIKKYIRNETKRTKRKIEVVLSESLHEYSNDFKEFNVIDGRNICREHVEDIINKLIGSTKIETQNIYFLSNSYNSNNVKIITKIASKVKSINIVTKDIRNYSTLENLLSEKGIIVTVSNNKKKSLKKAELIINLDFECNEVKKYSIYRNACIINLNDTLIKYIKCFDGTIINGIDISIPEEQYKKLDSYNLIVQFRKIELFESLRLNCDHVIVEELYGNNGIINEKERLNVQNILTK